VRYYGQLCYALARFPLNLFSNIEHPNTIIKLNDSVTEVESKLAQPPFENICGIVNGQGAIVAAPHTIVPGIIQIDKNIFLKSLRSSLNVKNKTTAATTNHIKDITGPLKILSIIANG